MEAIIASNAASVSRSLIIAVTFDSGDSIVSTLKSQPSLSGQTPQARNPSTRHVDHHQMWEVELRYDGSALYGLCHPQQHLLFPDDNESSTHNSW
jgi:hypothetical protein